MDAEALFLGLAAGICGLLLVGPRIAYAVQQWIGWRVVLPLILGWVPERRDAVVVVAPLQRRRWDLPIQLVTGALYAVAAARVGWSWSLAPLLVLVTGLIAASAVDLACWRIPTRFVYLTGLALGVTILVAALAQGQPGSLVGALVGGGGYLGFLGGLHLLSPRLLGFGDVRLGTMTGLAVGWLGWTAELPVLGPISWVLTALMVASLAGTVVGLVLLVVRRRSDAYPFGPWLALGALIVVLSLV